MKLELKHLVSYLPYGLMIENSIGRVVKLSVMDFSYHVNKGFKPILRPLSDLELDEFKNKIFNREYIVCEGCDADLGYYEWCYLFERHFDVFGLIEKGLAIDKNTLEK